MKQWKGIYSYIWMYRLILVLLLFVLGFLKIYLFICLLFRGMWDLPRPGLEPMSLVLAGGFLTTAPPGKSRLILLILLASHHFEDVNSP